MFKKHSASLLFFSTIVCLSMVTAPWHQVFANPLDNLRNAIKGRESDIQEIDQEIQQLQVQVGEKQAERKTLQEIVSDLSATQSNLEQKINTSQASISQLEALMGVIDNEISELEKEITIKQNGLKNNLQRIQIVDGDSLVEGLLRNGSLSDFWQEADVAQQLGAALGESMRDIRKTRSELEVERERQVAERARIKNLQQQVLVDKQSIDIAKSEQDRLLSITKNEEATYQSILAEKRELREAFENDLQSYESQLNIALNPALIPTPSGETLSWPLSSIVITQYFGNTAFAASGAYNGSGHNGIDLDVEVGTPILSARQGVVKGVGNTDAQCPYASYGKWILVEHDNGLSTLYAHLSSQTVSTGQAVTRGQVIGYGGNTGYSTGSHLHFTVYASEGVRVGGLPSRSCPGTTITLPLADLSAYLNPMEYLPG